MVKDLISANSDYSPQVKGPPEASAVNGSKYTYFFFNKTFPTLLFFLFLILSHFLFRISVSFLKLSISDSSSLCSVLLYLLSGWLWETSRSLWFFSLQSLSVLRPKTCRSVNIFCSCNHSIFVLSSDALHTWGYLFSLGKKPTGILLKNGQISEAISIQIWISIFVSLIFRVWEKTLISRFSG